MVLMLQIAPFIQTAAEDL